MGYLSCSHGACLRAVILKRSWWGYTGDWGFYGVDRETLDEAYTENIHLQLPPPRPHPRFPFKGHTAKAKDLISASLQGAAKLQLQHTSSLPLPLPLGRSVRVLVLLAEGGEWGGQGGVVGLVVLLLL